MPIPDYETLMLPLLKLASDEQPHYIRDVVEQLSDEFHLTPDERSELLPKSRQTIIYSRVHWARTYLKSAGLIEATSRGEFKITQQGLGELKTNPMRIDNEYLSQFPEFVDFKRRSRPEAIEPAEVAEQLQTPDELLESELFNSASSAGTGFAGPGEKCDPSIL